MVTKRSNVACPFNPGLGLALAEAREPAKLPIQIGPHFKDGRDALDTLERNSGMGGTVNLVQVASLGSPKLPLVVVLYFCQARSQEAIT